MKVTKQNLVKLEKEFKGYLEGKKVDEFFDEFGIKFAAGHWAAGDFCDRFSPVGYNSDINLDSDIVAQIKRVSEAGIKGIEFHEVLFIDKNYKKDKAKIERVKEATEKV